MTNSMLVRWYPKELDRIYILRYIGLIALLYIALITSWISDDAQITFRQILNFISGHGITFNFGERGSGFHTSSLVFSFKWYCRNYKGIVYYNIISMYFYFNVSRFNLY